LAHDVVVFHVTVLTNKAVEEKRDKERKESACNYCCVLLERKVLII